MDPNSPGSSHTQWLRKQFSSQENRSNGEVGPDLLVDKRRMAFGNSGIDVELSLIERNNIVNFYFIFVSI